MPQRKDGRLDAAIIQWDLYRRDDTWMSEMSLTGGGLR